MVMADSYILSGQEAQHFEGSFEEATALFGLN